MIKNMRNKISVKLLRAIIISFIVSFSVLFICKYIQENIISNLREQNSYYHISKYIYETGKGLENSKIKINSNNELDKFIKSKTKNMNIKILILDSNGNLIYGNQNDFNEKVDFRYIMDEYRSRVGYEKNYTKYNDKEELIFYPFYKENQVFYLIFKYPKKYDWEMGKLDNRIGLISLILSIVAFIITFIFMINKRVQYIKYISRKVKRIAKGNLGEILEVDGGDEIAELSESINSMSIQLKEKFDREREIENTKNELITNVSHDLRTPLTSIIGYLDLIRKKSYKTEEEYEEYIETIYNKSQNLNNLINELFEYTKLSNSKIELNYTQMDVCSLLEQLIGEYIPVLDTNNLKVIKQIPHKDIILNVDVDKIIRVFENILTNAIKYSVKPSSIEVKIKEDINNVNISFTNEVKDFKEKEVKKLFERFYRVDKSRKENESSGLGLAIAKKIIELHNGDIWAEYKENKITIHIKLNKE
ncbi:signal transduction histidine kinase [Gottschalkia purinilytica]|uniref:histidine kinase n=1 Tax=Gottschalkia purinilytica TaxID=1503 RepID=A0A0L0W6N8_GOTPU|nr:HAMP domain-containing sensor histidine kinase [Gottschalkia purinilytica]KNF07184.1 signal transduction histidine kinase [Gottschalkia purinilytica]